MTCGDLQEFGQIAVHKRLVMKVSVRAHNVYLGPILCSVAMDNALRTAFRHGHLDYAQVKLVIMVQYIDSTADMDASAVAQRPPLKPLAAHLFHDDQRIQEQQSTT